MQTRSKYIFAIFVIAAVGVSGCYTKLMTPNEFVHTQRSVSKKSFADNSLSINYHQSCVTCHSSTELNERAEELEYYGVQTVHDGVLLSSRQWNDLNFYDEPMIVMPSPYWPNPYNPVPAWWAPPATAVSTATTAAGDGNKPRSAGGTRDRNSEQDRSTPVSTTYTQPQTPVGGTSTVPSTPPPAVRVSPSTTPAQTNDSSRSRETKDNANSSNRTRSDGSSRDDSGDRPR